MSKKRKLKLDGGLRGRYFFEIVRPDGTVKRPFGEHWVENVVLNSGLEMMFNGASPSNNISDLWFTGVMAYARVGTGNTPADQTQVALVNQVGATGNYDTTGNSTSGNVSDASIDGVLRRVFIFDPPSVNVNLNEVGVSNSPILTENLFSRTVLPFTITIQTDEFLRLTYELQISIPGFLVFGYSGGFTFDGEVRGCGVSIPPIFGGLSASGVPSGNAYVSALRGRTGLPRAILCKNDSFDSQPSNFVFDLAGSSIANSIQSSETSSYSPGSYERATTFTFLANRPPGTVSDLRTIFIPFTGSTTQSSGLQYLLDSDQTKMQSNKLIFDVIVRWANA